MSKKSHGSSWDVATWAEDLSKYEVPRDILSVLENLLLYNTKANLRRLRHPVRGRRWAGFWFQMCPLYLGAPIVTFFAFTTGRWFGTTHVYAAWWAYPAAAICSVWGILVLVAFYVRWRGQRVRLRGRVAPTLSILYAITAALALSRAYAFASTFSGSIAWYVVPIWGFLFGALASAIYQYRSPKRAAWDWLIDTGGRRLDVRRVHPDDQRMLLEERNRALRILDERGFLPEASAREDLERRPLGELHLPLPAAQAAV